MRAHILNKGQRMKMLGAATRVRGVGHLSLEARPFCKHVPAPDTTRCSSKAIAGAALESA